VGFTPQKTVITLTKEENMINKKQKKNNFYNHDLNLTIDILTYTSDDELRNLHDSLHKERDMIVREGYSSADVETSICYTQRELDIREMRRTAHMNYVKSSNFMPAVQQATQQAAKDSNVLY
jgi:hypothetical protein